MSDEALARYRPHALAALRIMSGLIFMAHGLVKLVGFPEVEGMGRVELLSLAGIGA
jgi:putative oxidoreductase